MTNMNWFKKLFAGFFKEESEQSASYSVDGKDYEVFTTKTNRKYINRLAKTGNYYRYYITD